jgi:acetyl esterase/lipase
MPVPQGVRATRDIEYAKPDGKPQRLDLFVPEKAAGLLPLIIWVHGGAWSAGHKEWQPIPALPMTARGYAVATIDYRLSGEAKWPAQIHDCKAAVRFLRAHAKDHNLDPDRFGAWGSSAGGHLVAMLGTSGDIKELEGDLGNLGVSSRVQAVCDWFGPTDLLVLNNPNPVKGLLGGPAAENIAKAKQANPITWVSKDGPPFLIMHGDKDNAVSIQQSELLNEALKKAGVSVKFDPIPGVGHDFRGPEVVKWAILKPEYLKTVNEFFDEKLKGKK